ncbi:aspartate/glutamate racemase family protein [Streptomyces sp. JV176]|uniref:aspartate/glutamate racemase family protein n=1 Tax=Streptomyces sp. JV176 TaxID=858630 RepID=UPI002E75F73E|nr:aspartate/glutamate racemase family protein [Streptomyces sp. JV176]MEE1801748.1 aspartate/glutamate racemase family protein [Streptomyces sp. JV176]
MTRVAPPEPSSPVGLVRVLTSDDPALVTAHGRILEQHFGYPTLSRCIPDQPHGIHDEETERLAEPKIVSLARELADEGAGTVIISCAADPALARTRAAVGVPVIGAGSAAAAVALGLGTRVGVLGITDEAPPGVRAVLGPHFLGAVRPRDVHRTTDLLAPHGPAAVLAAATELVEAGADTLLLACTGLTTIGIRPLLEDRLSVPAVDAVLAAGLMASYARIR